MLWHIVFNVQNNYFINIKTISICQRELPLYFPLPQIIEHISIEKVSIYTHGIEKWPSTVELKKKRNQFKLIDSGDLLGQ